MAAYRLGAVQFSSWPQNMVLDTEFEDQLWSSMVITDISRTESTAATGNVATRYDQQSETRTGSNPILVQLLWIYEQYNPFFRCR
jgi:hypothetical protein